MSHDISALPEKIVYLDKNAPRGGDGSKASPFRCLSCAFAEAKKILAALTEPAHVILDIAAGDYTIRETLLLSGEDMPVEGSHFTVRGDGNVTVSSLEEIPTDKFAKTSTENIYSATLMNADGTPKRYRYLYVDGKLVTPAVSGGTKAEDPATRRHRYERTFDAKGEGGDYVKAQGKMYLDRSLLAPIIGDKTEGVIPVTDAELHTVAEWDYNIIHITAIDLNDTVLYKIDDPKDAWFFFSQDGVIEGEEHVAVYLRPDEYAKFCMPGGFPFRGRHYFLQNHPTFVSREGDFYRDGKSGALTYYTEGDITAHTFAIPRLARLFSLLHINGVTFEGIAFTGTDDFKLSEFGTTSGQASCDGRFHDYPNAAAIYGNSCKNLTVKNCRFYDLGCEGISLRGRVEDLTVTHNVFRNIPSAAIRSGGPLGNWDDKYGNLRLTITYNDLDNIATVYYASPAICMASTKDSLLSRNTITNCSYSGYSVAWCWDETKIPRGKRVNIDNVEISENYIASFCTEMCDGGAIYVLGCNAPRDYHELFNFVKRNCVVYTNKTANGNGNLVCGIYFDGSSTNWHALDNVIVEQSLGGHPSDTGIENLPARYVTRLQNRFSGSFFGYTQHHGTPAPDFNILWERTHFLNARGADRDADMKDAFRGLLCEERWCTEKDSVFVHGWNDLPETAVRVIENAGCDERKCNLDELKNNRY